MMTTCKVLYQCEHVIDVIEWAQAPRAGKKKNGEQNTQLELGTSKMSFSDTVKKLLTQLGVCRFHQFHYEWRNIIRKVDHSMSHPDVHRVFCTDFGATLDLCAIEKDNFSVDNHCVVCIFFLSHNSLKGTMLRGFQVVRYPFNKIFYGQITAPINTVADKKILML